jgi:hypothetical protein
MFIGGIEFAGHSMFMALGVTSDGTKTSLGIWAGSTESTVVVTELWSNVVVPVSSRRRSDARRHRRRQGDPHALLRASSGRLPDGTAVAFIRHVSRRRADPL